jgi:transcriptional regulator with XRE-family HTH domain
MTLSPLEGPPRIRELREALRSRFGQQFSRPAVARRVGISVRTLVNYEQGVTEPSYSVARTLAEDLGVSMDQLGIARRAS